MKKRMLAAMLILLLFSLCACRQEISPAPSETGPAQENRTSADDSTEDPARVGGNIDHVVVKDVASDIYSADDINAAITVIEEEFAANWDRCTLKEIGYAGDKVVKKNKSYKDDYKADEVMVLLSSFDVGESDGSLEPGSSYDEWKWILVRKDGGEWEHVDHGY